MNGYIALLRPKQWIKILFVLTPMFFGGSFGDADCWLRAGVAGVTFCMLSSAVYCINDVCDAKSDRQHPTKCNRPIAAGIVSRSTAIAIATILIATSIVISQIFGLGIELILAAYLAINIAYSLWLKRIAVVDVAIVAGGFGLRVVAGGIATGIDVSNWLIVMTVLLATFLLLPKRRYDALTGKATTYSVTILNYAVGIAGVVTFIFYILYTISEEVTSRFDCSHIYLTAIPVGVGISRYLYITFRNNSEGDPTNIVYRDRAIQLCLMVWIVAFYLIIYR